MPITTAISDHEDRLDQARHPHDLLAIVAVDVDAGQQAHDQARDGRDHQRQADRERGLRLAIDIDAGGQVGERRTRPSR